jgi:preprotein translocase SecE subunit
VSRITGLFRRASQFIREAIRELQKAQWPTKQELTGFTLVVIVALAAIAVYIGLLDIILYQVSQLWQPTTK